ncbi:hypothetical protein BH09ACT3_BH09ACT3_09650 [soil metagenome]
MTVSESRDVQPPKRKRRWLAPLIVTGSLLVLLVGGFVVVDGVVRDAAEKLVGEKVRSSLSLPETTPVAVEIHGSSVLLQALSGSLERVEIGVANLSIGDLSGDATLVATGVPIDQAQPIGEARLQFTIGQDGVQKLLAGLSGLPASSATIDDGAVTLATEFRVLGFAIPVGATVGLSAESGELVITPESVELNGAAVDADELPSPVRGLFDTQSICVATLLPQAFALDSVTVTGDSVVLAVSGRQLVLDSALFSTKGTCPA